MIPLFTLLLSGPAFAEEEPEPVSDEAPLAIPADALERTPRDRNTPPVERPAKGAAAEGVTPAKLRAFREYQAGYLYVGAEREIRGGGTQVVHTWHGPRRYRWHTTTVVNNPVYTTRTWAVYQGPHRLSTPEIYGAVGRNAERDALEGELARLDRKARVFYGVGFAGVAATLGGVMTQAFATTAETQAVGGLVTLGGVGAMLTGFVGGSFPASKSSDLRHYPALSFEPRELQRELDATNEALRQELGLSPAEVMRIEGVGASRGRGPR